ncbi:ornithine cyclodeaminase family protein [Virgibacillus ihumii]|uniref:ornithine cyclodeaminase family protein n=1 Tax=Virgibacillus ihumii TaxID=2686091 RepID=UPI00157BF4AA|nr:ornithine cyclodeaminase family protein [Virgibacillus ihumii]
MLFLNEHDIRDAVSMKDMIDAIDDSYEICQAKKFTMPTRIQVPDGDNTLLLMPCIIDDAIGTKLVSSFPNNTTSPVLHGLVILNNQENGEIKALMDGSFITGFRTGAIGGSAIRHLAKQDVSSIAVIGTGVQGLYQAVAACTERQVTDIYVFNRTAAKIPSYKELLQQWIDNAIQIHAMDSAAAAAENAEIIITATTAKTPVLPDDQSLFKGKLIIGIGSFQPGMREFPRSLYQLTDDIFIDTEDAITESGDIATPLAENWISRSSIKTMAHLITSNESTVSQHDSTIIFKSTGMALFDTVTANLIYKRAIEKRIGTILA